MALPLDHSQSSNPPPRKRIKKIPCTENTSEKGTPRLSLFAPFRALGLITNYVPFVLQARSYKGATDGPRVHILTCLGRSWALWEGGKMTLLFVGPEAPYEITSMAMDGDAIWVTSGPLAIKYIRGKEIQRITNILQSSITSLSILGTNALALSEDGSKMFVWDTTGGELLSTIQFESDFNAVSILHPATYLNKVLVSSRQGTMQLWNIKSSICIHTFSTSIGGPSTGNDQAAAITALTQAPAIDVVGIGLKSGYICIHDVRTDEQLMRLRSDGEEIKSLAFRSDGHPILASASSTGHISLFDLNSGGQLLHVVRGAHEGSINSIEWIPGQPVLVSSGDDNSVKQWLFDSPTAQPRLLKFRSGHHAPPHIIRYCGNDGKQLLTASRDRSLRCTSIVRDSRSFELSQGSLAKKAAAWSIPVASLKLPPISSLAYSPTRSKDWDDILTVHADEPQARTWSMQQKKVGKHIFSFEPEKTAKEKNPAVGVAKSVCVTACGNFGLASSSAGQIYMWNMQSGIKRKSFDIGPCPASAAQRFTTSSKKKGRVITGLVTDSLNVSVIASTLDGTINFFDFHTGNLEHTVIFPSAIVSILLHQDSGLLAVISDDMLIRVLDIETRRIVRELGGFRGRVLDVAFSPDCRWLVATSLDSIIRTFDLPTGQLIDAFRTSSVATSLSFSPVNDFLATAHVDSIGVYLWANRAQYGEVSLKTVSDTDLLEVSLPAVHGEEDETFEGLSALTAEDAPLDIFVTPPQLDGDLITLTLLPRSRWQTLLNLDVIQRRNKPKEPPKAPEKAPFFLPTLPGVEPRFQMDIKTDKTTQKSKKIPRSTAADDSVFLQKLSDEDDAGDSFFVYAKTLSPAALDLEIRSITLLEHLRMFTRVLIKRLLSHRDFEAVQAFQGVFLRIHGDTIVENSEVLVDLERLIEVQKQESKKVLDLISSSLGTLGFVRDVLT